MTKQKTVTTQRRNAAAMIRPRPPVDALAGKPVPAAARPEDAPPGPPPAAPLLSLAGTPIDPESLLFDMDWYRLTYPDVAAAALDPVRHFFDNGAREGRNPNPHFDTAWYLSANGDVGASKMNPFLHYLLYGAREGRKPKP